MIARIAVEVANRREADQLRDGLADPAVRAFVKVIGTLAALPTDRARDRVLRYVAEQFDDDAAAAAAARERDT
jgi:hypothetical protein